MDHVLHPAHTEGLVYIYIVFASRPGDRGSIPGLVIPKTQKMVLDASLLNTQHYKARIKGKWDNLGKRLGVIAIEEGTFGSLSAMVGQHT